MNDDEIKIPPFVQNYIDQVDGNGLADFVKISAEYQKEKQDYPGKFAEQSAHLNYFNRRTGQNKTLDYEDGLKGIETRYRQRAYQIAKQNGYKGPDPNQPSDKAFTKQGEKFQDMIDKARQREQEQTKQPEQKHEPVPGTEAENIEALKNQQSYQQNKPNVEFKEMEQEQPFSTEQQNREQQRTAFLEQIKKTREQQTQQRDKQPEI